jgi:hypothetical protein
MDHISFAASAAGWRSRLAAPSNRVVRLQYGTPGRTRRARVVVIAGGLVRVARPCRCDRLFDRPEPAPTGPSDRIFYLTITAGKRTRKLAINDPVEAPQLAHLIRLTRYALRDREVLSPEMLNDVQLAALQAALLDVRERDPDDDPVRISA